MAPHVDKEHGAPTTQPPGNRLQNSGTSVANVGVPVPRVDASPDPTDLWEALYGDSPLDVPEAPPIHHNDPPPAPESFELHQELQGAAQTDGLRDISDRPFSEPPHDWDEVCNTIDDNPLSPSAADNGVGTDMVQNPPTIIYRPIVYHVVNADPALPPETTVAYIPDLLQTAQAASTFRSMQPTVHRLADANPANPANPANRPHSANPAARSNGATAVNLSLGYATNFPRIASAAVAPREELRSIGLHIPPARGGGDKPEGLGLLLEKPFGRAMAAEVAKAKKGNDRKANQARETNDEAPYTAAHAQAGQKATGGHPPHVPQTLASVPFGEMFDFIIRGRLHRQRLAQGTAVPMPPFFYTMLDQAEDLIASIARRRRRSVANANPNTAVGKPQHRHHRRQQTINSKISGYFEHRSGLADSTA